MGRFSASFLPFRHFPSDDLTISLVRRDFPTNRAKMTTTTIPGAAPARHVIKGAVVRFAGDSGDGMQVTGDQFTSAAALAQNDLATFPDFPAEIRAPAGTLYGVSGFQIHFSSQDVFTPGD